MPLNAGIMFGLLSERGRWNPDCDCDMKHNYSTEKYGDEGYSCYA